MTLKDIELELIELRKEHEAMAEVVKHHIKNFDKLRNWHKLESQANVVVNTKIVEMIKEGEEACFDAMADASVVENGAIEKNLDVFYAGKHRAYEEMSDYISNFI